MNKTKCAIIGSGNIGTDLSEALENTGNASNEDFEEIEDLLTEEEMEIYRTNHASEDDLDDLLSDRNIITLSKSTAVIESPLTVVILEQPQLLD